MGTELMHTEDPGLAAARKLLKDQGPSDMLWTPWHKEKPR
jgi:hypothetical protein